MRTKAVVVHVISDGSVATQPYIAFLDADDAWGPQQNKNSIQLDAKTSGRAVYGTPVQCTLMKIMQRASTHHQAAKI